jgi:predicted O-methyltransferase YrrM
LSGAPGQPAYAVLERQLQVPGWSPLEQLFALFLLACASRDVEGDLLEVGAWCGRSSVALGLAAQVTGNARVLSIDLFPHRDDWHENADGSFSLRVDLGGQSVAAYDVQTVWREPFLATIKPVYARHDSVFDIFRENIEANGLTEVVSAQRGTSELLGAMGSRRFRLAFVDADHSYEAVCRDIDHILPLLSPGGWLCFDDAFTSYEGVDRALRERVLASDAFDLHLQPTRKLFVARKRLAA